jgi:tetratricopeptide (TPR) repeat protein
MDRCKQTPAPLADRLLLDQSECWLHGEPLPVEAYLKLHPNVAADREAVLDLICHEYLLRKRRGESPDAQEYLRRFPAYADDLRDQFEVGQLIVAENDEVATVIGSLPVWKPSRPSARVVAGYEVLSKLGSGGMGVVYLARHVELQRLVALKMIRSPQLAGPRQLARFRGEAEALARIQHPNIIQIYEVGECEGQPFLALEYLPGGSLDRRLQGSPQPPRQAAQMIRALAGAVDAAHQAGVIHRDLKPGNVLLSSNDTPKVTDFGLAKRLDAGTGQTTTGDILGTPPYMAPEQAHGRKGAVGPWTDVYALGAILYEMLTGRPPFNGATVWETLEQMATLDPVPPSQLQVRVPRDLEVICLKCLAKEPARRYARAADLAEDLRRFQAGEPIRARPAPLWERVWKWARRHPALTVAGGAALLSIVALLGGTFIWLKASASQAELAAREAKDRAAAALARAEIKDGLRQVESACTARHWDEARVGLESVIRQLEVAQQAANNDVQLDEVSVRVNELGRTIETQLTARERLARFRTLRTEAGFLVLGLAGVSPEDRPARVREVVKEVFGLFGADLETGPLPAPDSGALTGDEQREVREGCCELLVNLVGVMSESSTADRVQPRRRPVERELVLLDRATRLQASAGICHMRRARLLGRLGQDQKAQAEEEKGRASPPVRAFEFFLRGCDRYADGNLTGAKEDFEKALNLEPDHTAAAYAVALPHLRLRLAAQPAEARAHLIIARMSLTVCINRQPELPWPYLCRAFAHGELGEVDAAEADFLACERALQGRNDNAARYALLVSRGALRIRAHKLDKAVTDLKEAQSLRPQDYQAHVNLARAYQLQKHDTDALHELDRAIELGTPASLSALYRTRARLHEEAGRNEAAARDLEQAAHLEPGGPKAPPIAEDMLARGRLLGMAGDQTGALQAFDAALLASPDHPAALRARAEVLLRLQRNDEALRDLTHLLDGDRIRRAELAPLYRARAATRAQQQDHGGAIEDYTHALLLEPEAGALKCRGWSYLAVDAPRLAQADFEQSLCLNPKDGDALNGLASARVLLGRYRDAVENAEEALRLGPANARLRYNAARVFAQAGQKAELDLTLQDEQRRYVLLQYHERAMVLLREAVEALPAEQRGRFWSGTVCHDTAFAPVRASHSFRELTTRFPDNKPER